jgi:branched-chain amino acid transport system ATP-binding protein
MSTPADEALEVTGLSAGYGRVQVVSDVTLRVEPGEIVAVVGRNGAGKTTSLMAIAGLRYGAGGGTVRIAGVDASGLSPSAIVAAGFKLVPEGRRLFREMSVLENLRLGAWVHHRSSKEEMKDLLDRVYTLFPVLARDRNRPVLSLSGGQQQMVAVGQALMSRPRFLALDEPSAGLAPVLVDNMYDAFAELASDRIGVLVVDQNIERVLECSHRFYVVEAGAVVRSGAATDPGALEAVTKIVLGTDRQREDALDAV